MAARPLTGQLLDYAGTAIIWAPVLFNIAAVIVHREPVSTLGFYITGAAVELAGCILERDWPWAGFFAVMLAGLAAGLWRRRRKRRALAALGAKGKARIAAMVAKMRDRATPRPVLRPGLQGAR
jgi:hypothetical protein